MSNAIIHTRNIQRKAEGKPVHEQSISHYQTINREREREGGRERRRERGREREKERERERERERVD